MRSNASLFGHGCRRCVLYRRAGTTSHDRQHEASLPAHALPDRLCRVASVGGEASGASAASAMSALWTLGHMEKAAMTDIEAALRAVPLLKCQYCGPQEACPHHCHPDFPALAAVVREVVEEKDTTFKQAIADLFDGMACDPRCDAEAHEEACPATHGPSAVRRLRARLAEQAGEVERLHAAYDTLTGERFSDRVHVALRQRLDRAHTEIERLRGALEEVERHCPCGARPEAPKTHPHVTGCPVALALRATPEAGG